MANFKVYEDDCTWTRAEYLKIREKTDKVEMRRPTRKQKGVGV